MSEIDPETLILAMKKHPALYNKYDINYYSHKKHKAKLWTEVCKEVFQNFDNLKPQQKVEYGHELQRRWKSLRTCFSRELANQRKEKHRKQHNERPMKKRKRYEHFNLMTFLLDCENSGEDAETANEISKESDDSRDSDDPLDLVEAAMQPADVPNTSRYEVLPDTAFPTSVYERRNENLEDKILDMLKEIKKDEEDEDRQFMLSLVPSFRKLQPKQKFEARIEILRVLKDITFKDDS